MIKIFNIISLLLLLNGCVQNSALFGSAFTVASTGNVSQAGISLGSDKVISKVTGKSAIKNIQDILTPNKNENKIISSVKTK